MFFAIEIWAHLWSCSIFFMYCTCPCTFSPFPITIYFGICDFSFSSTPTLRMPLYSFLKNSYTSVLPLLLYLCLHASILFTYFTKGRITSFIFSSIPLIMISSVSGKPLIITTSSMWSNGAISSYIFLQQEPALSCCNPLLFLHWTVPLLYPIYI